MCLKNLHPIQICSPQRAPWLLSWTLVVINGRAEAMDGPGTKQEESHKEEVWEEAWLPFSAGQGSTAMEEHVITRTYPHSGGHQHYTEQHPEQSQDTPHNQHAVSHTRRISLLPAAPLPHPPALGCRRPMRGLKLQGRGGGGGGGQEKNMQRWFSPSSSLCWATGRRLVMSLRLELLDK